MVEPSRYRIYEFLNTPLQMNAILDLSRAPGTDQFSSSWVGPHASNLDLCGQFAALEVFNAAIGGTADVTTSVTRNSF